MVSIRAVRRDEWPLWCDMRVAALSDSPDAFTSRLSEWPTTGMRRWRERFDSADACNLLAENDYQPVGIVSGLTLSARECQLRSLWVAPLARGCGVADQLVEAVIDWSIGKGAAVLTLSVIAENMRAIAFYRRHGFVEVGEGDDRPAVQSSGEIVMVKDVATASS